MLSYVYIYISCFLVFLFFWGVSYCLCIFMIYYLLLFYHFLLFFVSHKKIQNITNNTTIYKTSYKNEKNEKNEEIEKTKTK